MKKWFAVLALMLMGCGEEPLSRTASNNPNFKVDLLFEHDGCKVYRFYDGNMIYFAKCAKSVDSSVSWEQSQGKTSYPKQVPTGGDQ